MQQFVEGASLDTVSGLSRNGSGSIEQLVRVLIANSPLYAKVKAGTTK
jgi:hypothetical protein